MPLPQTENEMTKEQLTQAVLTALSGVESSAGGVDVVARGQVRALEVDDEGTVRFAFFMAPEDPGSLVKELRAVAGEVEGVTAVKVNVQLPQSAPTPPQGAPQPQGGP